MAKREADAAFDEAAATRDAKKLKVAELRAALEAAGADTKGLKAELVERLVAAARDGSAEVPPAPPSAKDKVTDETRIRRGRPVAAEEGQVPAKPQPDGQKIEIVRLDARARYKRRSRRPSPTPTRGRRSAN